MCIDLIPNCRDFFFLYKRNDYINCILIVTNLRGGDINGIIITINSNLCIYVFTVLYVTHNYKHILIDGWSFEGSAGQVIERKIVLKKYNRTFKSILHEF